MQNRTFAGVTGALAVAAVGIGFFALGATPVHSPAPNTGASNAGGAPQITPSVQITIPEGQQNPKPNRPFAPQPGLGTASGEEDLPFHTGNSVTFDLTQHSPDAAGSLWVVVNKARPLQPEKYAPKNLVNVRGVQIADVAAPDLRALLEAAQSDGVNLRMRTAYRSYGQQQYIFNQRVAAHGRARAEQGTARPGHTEHQTGLAVDFVARNRSSCDLRACFGQTPESVWLAEHAWEFGFIQRYTEQNTDVTGFMAESWHYRYVGRELAEYLHTSEVGSLEELFGVAGGGEYLD